MLPALLVLIASYRDPELLLTLQEAITQAQSPERLHFGVCWQGSDEEWERDQAALESVPNLSFSRWHYRESQGACWARRQTQQLWQGQHYIYQIDSHCMFAQDWDETLVSMLSLCLSEKPLLTCYPASYDPKTRELQQGALGIYMGASGFNDHGILTISNAGNNLKTEPAPGFLVSGSAIFTLGKWCEEVPYPPLYFNGEEPLVSVASWCAGYDIYYPHKQTLYHNYARDGAVRHWSDNLNVDRELKSYARFRQLLGMEPREEELLTGYTLPTVRSLSDYEQYTGISFSTKTIAAAASKGIPASLSEEEQAVVKYRKVGAFIPAHNNPYFLRMAVLQVMAQTKPPEVLVIHQNNDSESYLWVIDDLLHQCQQLGIFLEYLHTPVCPLIQNWDVIGLKVVQEHQCDYIFKLDHDDIYEANHFETIRAYLDEGWELVGNRRAGLLKLKDTASYEYSATEDFAAFNPIQLMTSSIGFSRNFGEAVIKACHELDTQPCVIDVLIRERVLWQFEGKIMRVESATPTSTYVCYGSNVSTRAWIPEEQRLLRT